MMKLLTTKEAAEILGVCEQRIRLKLKQGHFPNARPPQDWLIPEEDVEANLGVDRRARSKDKSAP